MNINEFELKLKERHGDMYSLTENSKYIDRDTKMEFKCNLCNSLFETAPKTIMTKNRKGCKNCRVQNMNKPQAISKEEFLKKLDEKYKGEFILIGEYIDYKTKTLFKHTVCGYEEHETTPRQLILHHSKFCNKCNGSYKKDSNAFANQLEEGYELISEYKNNKTKVTLLHKTCNKEYKVTPNRYLSGDRCPHCYGNYKTHDEFLVEFNDLSKNLYSLQSEYKNNDTKLSILHNGCGRSFCQTARSILNYGIRCSHCYPTISAGALKVKNYLEDNGFNFEMEKTFDTCLHINVLRFDFFIPELELLIEYDGKQHFKPIFGDIEDFKIQQKRDQIKNQWCKDNNMNLLRISYKEKDLDKILYDFFESYKF